MGLVPKRLPSSKMGGLGEPRQLIIYYPEQGAPVDRNDVDTMMA
jgi:hypothetical protein